jgi:hypothetical protein
LLVASILKNHTLNIILFLFILVVSEVDLFAQSKGSNKFVEKVKPQPLYNRQLNYIKIVGGLGVANYYGDLCHSFDCYVYRPNTSIGAYFRYNYNWSFRAEVNYFRMYGTDVGGKWFYRNLTFRSNNFEISAVAIYDIFKYNRNFLTRKKITPYLFGGVGMLYFEPYGELNGSWYKLRPLQTEGVKYLPMTMTIPFGGGLRYKLNPLTDISFEIGYRKTFSDRIDDVSENFVAHNDPLTQALMDKRGLVDDPRHKGRSFKVGANRGNPSKKDGFMNFGFKVEYKIANTRQIQRFYRVTPRFATGVPPTFLERVFKKRK